MPTINVRWADNTAQLKTNLREGVNQIEATKTSVERMVRALSGDNLVSAAHKWTAAISQMGGVSKLAAADAERAFGTITKAIDTLERQSKTVPDAMRALAKELKAAGDAGKHFGMSLDQLQQNLSKFGSAARSIGVGLTAAITVPLVGAGVGAVKLAMDFESSFAGVKKTVEATDAEFATMAQALRDLAKTIPVNVNELNRLAEAAGALGIPKAEIVEFSRVMALLGVTTNVTSDQAAEGIAKIQNIFGKAGKETENFASTLVALGNAGASTESQILEMSTRIAGAGNAVGLSQGEVLAFASALSSVGIEAEAGGSSISKVFIEIASAVQQGGNAIKGFADVADIEVTKFSQLFKEDAAGATNAFIQGLGRIKAEGGNLLGTIEALGFAEIRVRDTLLRAAGAGDLLAKSLDIQAKAWSENSALSEEARKRFETTTAQLTILWQRIKDVGITIGNALLPGIQAMTTFFTKLLPIIDGIAKAFALLPGSTQLLVVGFLAIVAAVGPILVAFGSVALGLERMIALYASLGVAAKASSAAEVLAAQQAAAGVAAARGGAGAAAGLGISGWMGLAPLGMGGKRDISDAEIAELKRKLAGMPAVPGRPASAVSGDINLRPGVGPNAAGFVPGNITNGLEEIAAAAATMTDEINAAKKAIAELAGATRKDLVAAIKSGGYSIKEMADRARVSELAVKLFKEEIDGAAKSAKTMSESAKKVAEALAHLSAIQREGFGTLSKTVWWLTEVGKSTQSFLEGIEKVSQPTDDIEKLKEKFKELGDVIRTSILTIQDIDIRVRVGGMSGMEANDTLPKLLDAGVYRQLGLVVPQVTSSLGDMRRMVSGGSADLSDLSQAFSQLAQISGDSFSGVVQDLGKVIGTVNLVQQASKALNKELLVDGTASWQTYAASAISALTAVFSVQQMIVGYFERKDLADAIGHTAATLGKDFGVVFSRTLTEQVQRTFDRLQGQYLRFQAMQGKPMSLRNAPDFREGAEAVNLKDIIAEAGGLTTANIATYTASFKALFNAIKTGQITVAQGTKVLEENWQAFVEAGTDAFGFLSRDLKEIIELDRVMGTQSKAIAGYLKSQGAAAVAGSNAAIGALRKETDALEVLNKKVLENADAQLAAQKAGDRTAQAKLAKEALQLWAEQAFAAKDLRGALDDLGIVALGTFGAMVASGHSFAESLAAAQPGLEQLARSWHLVGAESDNAALKALLLQSSILKNNPALLQGVDGLASSFAALSNMGVLNVETFAAMQRAGMAMYTRVQGEVAKLGGSTKDALLPMQAYLHAAEEAAKDLGIPLDANTQMLIKDSKEAGIWQETKKTAIEVQTAAMDSLIKKIEKLINTLLGIPDVDFDVNTNYTSSGSNAPPAVPPPLPPPFGPSSPITWWDPANPPVLDYAAGGGIVTASGIQPWSMGASLTGPRGADRIPVWLSEGETVRTPRQEAALSGGGGEMDVVDVHAHLYLEGREVTAVVLNDVLRDKRGAGTTLKKSLGLPR